MIYLVTDKKCSTGWGEENQQTYFICEEDKTLNDIVLQLMALLPGEEVVLSKAIPKPKEEILTPFWESKVVEAENYNCRYSEYVVFDSQVRDQYGLNVMIGMCLGHSTPFCVVHEETLDSLKLLPYQQIELASNPNIAIIKSEIDARKDLTIEEIQKEEKTKKFVSLSDDDPTGFILLGAMYAMEIPTQVNSTRDRLVIRKLTNDFRIFK